MRDNFNYHEFVKSVLAENPNVPHPPAGMCRAAAVAGSPLEGEQLRKKLREHCESLANMVGYKRVRNKDFSGYQYMQVND